MGTVIVDNDYIEYCSTAGQPGLTIIMACTLVVLEIKEFAQAYAVTHGQLLNCLNSLQGPTNVQCIPSKLGLNQIPCSMQVLVCARGYNTHRSHWWIYLSVGTPLDLQLCGVHYDAAWPSPHDYTPIATRKSDPLNIQVISVLSVYYYWIWYRTTSLFTHSCTRTTVETETNITTTLTEWPAWLSILPTPGGL